MWLNMTRYKSVISRLGGKKQLLKNIIPILEQCQYDYDIKTFIDLCGGSGKVTLNIDKELFDNVIFNEIDKGICALFECLKDKEKTKVIMGDLERLDYSEYVFNTALQKLEDIEHLNVIDAAVYTYIVAKQSWTANMERYNKSGEYKGSYIDNIYELDGFYDDLINVEISNKDCRVLLKEHQECIFDLIYIDPPYVPDTMAHKETYGKLSWKDKDHEELVNLLLKTKAKIVLSGYDNNIYTRLVENGWTKIFLKTVHVSSSGTGRKKGEFIWVNFDIHSSIIDEVNEDELY